MDLSVGIDLVSVARIDSLLERWGERFLGRIFTEGEIEYSMSKPHPARSLAARFAAKEAFFKALSMGAAAGISFREIEVVIGVGGVPSIKATGRAAAALGGRKVALGISHEKDFAVAHVTASA